MWFVFALITTLAWGAADLFYKKGNNENDRYSHLRTGIMVGIVMGIHAIGSLLYLIFVMKETYDPMNILFYLPVSAFYILSMIIGYAGLRYLRLSIISPVQNSSGAVAALLCFFILGQSMDIPQFAAVALISAAIVFLGFFERRNEKASETSAVPKKYIYGFRAFVFPLLYCLLDGLGTFLDAFYLDDISTTPLRGVTDANFETVANISYEFTFLIMALLFFIYLTVVKKQRFSILKEGKLGTAAIFETTGQFTYVYAMQGNGIVAAPMIASYSIVSVVLSAIFLREKLKLREYIAVAAVMIGIAILGIYDA